MMFIIVTCRSLLWFLSTIGTFMAVLSATFYPRWLISENKTYYNKKLNKTYEYNDRIGIYNKCQFSRRLKKVFCRPYASELTEVTSIAWQCALFFLGVSLLLLGIACIFAIISFCKQIIKRKSLMNLAGILQTFAGLFMIVVCILYPLGWDNDNIKDICHNENQKASKFNMGNCSMGLSFFCAIGGMAGCFFCAMFSFVADKAVFSAKVQDEILEGKRLICVF
ncbi:LHFPL tetraspan subfamily member 2 protein-like [Clytia hemisphaerica]|uniref:Uncharacterized protein n=1 Tax=Clytia hemisphaerica TaxID=252671 RepID=A0A7M5UPR2_9CNID